MNTMLTRLRNRKIELLEMLQALNTFLNAQEGLLREVMGRHLSPPRDPFLVFDSAKKAEALSAAIAEADVMKGVANGVLARPGSDDVDPFTFSFFHFIDRFHELMGLNEILGWLDHFETSARTRDSDGILDHLVQLAVETPDACDCSPDRLRHPHDPRAWMHPRHTEYNRAIWEIIMARPGLMKELCEAAHRDLNVPDIIEGERTYGKIFLKSYGRELLRHFLQARPSPAWVARVSPRQGRVASTQTALVELTDIKAR